MNGTEENACDADWDISYVRDNEQKGILLGLRGGNTYRLRLFHKPQPVLRYYVNGRTAICGDPKTCPIAIKYPTIRPKSRYAIIVIDRLDQRVKVLEAPASVFEDFRKFRDTFKIDPGGTDAVDFLIEVTGAGINSRYKVSHTPKKTPFTDDEKQMLREAHARGYRLDELFAPTPVDQIESILFPDGTPYHK